MNRKPRILLVNEFSELNTGYSVYGKNVMSYLYNTDKYDLAELACYFHPKGQPFQGASAEGLPWTVYVGAGDPSSQEEANIFNADQFSQFGRPRFNDVVLHFRPDIVFDFRDTWMYDFELTSPFRPFYNHVAMPTCDGMPQNEEWIAQFMASDAVFTYSDWAKGVITEQTSGRVTPISSLSPGADFQIFKPELNKGGHKQSVGLSPDSLLIGTVMRNQKRKLYPDLFVAFAKFLSHCSDNNKELGLRTYLYCHTSYPDAGWDIPRLLKDYGISHKVLFTYMCHNCSLFMPMIWQDARFICPRCNSYSMALPSTAKSIDNKSLCGIYNLFDIYIQLANSEGMGMPQVEAAACGLPLMSTNYSAMIDVIKKLKSFPIPVLAFSKEPETHIDRAIPDIDAIVQHWVKFLSLPESLRKKKGFETRNLALKHYQWEATAKGWETYFDNVSLQPLEQTWLSQPRLHNPVMQVPPNLSTAQLVSWAVVNVLGDPSKYNDYISLRFVKHLIYNAKIDMFGGPYIEDASFLGQRPRWREYKPEEMLQEMYGICQERNLWERRRCGIEQYNMPEFIKYTKPDRKMMVK